MMWLSRVVNNDTARLYIYIYLMSVYTVVVLLLVLSMSMDDGSDCNMGFLIVNVMMVNTV